MYPKEPGDHPLQQQPLAGFRTFSTGLGSRNRRAPPASHPSSSSRSGEEPIPAGVMRCGGFDRPVCQSPARPPSPVALTVVCATPARPNETAIPRVAYLLLTIYGALPTTVTEVATSLAVNRSTKLGGICFTL